MPRAFSKLQTENVELELVLSELKAVLDPLTDSPMFDGILVSGVQLNSSVAVSVPHNLGRVADRFIVANDEFVEIKDVTPNPVRSNALLLLANAGTPAAPITVSLWIF